MYLAIFRDKATGEGVHSEVRRYYKSIVKIKDSQRGWIKILSGKYKNHGDRKSLYTVLKRRE